MTGPAPFGSLAGAVVVVTGGASGIGLATAVAASSAGANVMLADRNRSALDEATSTLAGTKVAAAQADVTDPAEVQRLVEATLGTFGRVDALVTSAGVEDSVPALELSATTHSTPSWR